MNNLYNMVIDTDAAGYAFGTLLTDRQLHLAKTKWHNTYGTSIPTTIKVHAKDKYFFCGARHTETYRQIGCSRAKIKSSTPVWVQIESFRYAFTYHDTVTFCDYAKRHNITVMVGKHGDYLKYLHFQCDSEEAARQYINDCRMHCAGSCLVQIFSGEISNEYIPCVQAQNYRKITDKNTFEIH